MNICIQRYQGKNIKSEIEILSEFRLRFFREFPYLYVGTMEEEQELVESYLVDPTTRLVVARDRDASNEIVGVAIGTELSSEIENLFQSDKSSQNNELLSEPFFYFGEMIFLPDYRSKGIGKQLLEELKKSGREQGFNRFCFLAVERANDDIRRPADYVDSELFFRKFGFEKTDVFVSFDWNTIQAGGHVEKTTNRLNLWVDNPASEQSLSVTLNN
jgi:ribosomal protein S18 acetylase RimI-like enzyme